MKFVIITVSLFIITSALWIMSPYYLDTEYVPLFGIIPCTLSMPMALALALHKYHLRIVIKNKKISLERKK
jgi:ABC-type anion transport system duplicated permease subunit